MKKIIAAISIIVLVILALYAIIGSFGSTSVPASAPAETAMQHTAPATQTPSMQASAVSVSIQNFSFSPKTLTIAAGTKVTWTNRDSVEHTVTANNGLFDSKALAPGQSFSYTFTTAGSVAYHCAIHPMMTASVTVQ